MVRAVFGGEFLLVIGLLVKRSKANPVVESIGCSPYSSLDS